METKLSDVLAAVKAIQQDPLQLNQLRPCILQLSELTSAKQRAKAATALVSLFGSYLESGVFSFKATEDQVENYLLTCYSAFQDWGLALLEVEEGKSLDETADIPLTILKLKLQGEVWTEAALGQWVSLLLAKKIMGLKVLSKRTSQFADLALAVAFTASQAAATHNLDTLVDLLASLPKVLPSAEYFAVKHLHKPLKQTRRDNFDPSLEASRVTVPDSLDSVYRLLLNQAWLSVVSSPLSVAACRRLLKKLSTKILPNLADPLCLSDFLVGCFERDSSLAVLALHGLFILITRHGLELKEYYTKLYGLLHDIADALDYHSGLLRLTELSLSSTALPAALVASFVKFFLRTALTSSLTVTKWAVGFAVNSVRTHATLSCMLHNAQTVECYLETEPDPLKTQALNSSLWELPLLMKHYDSTVRSLASQLTKSPEVIKKVKLDALEEPSLEAAKASVKAWPYNSD
jgi:hypothetical protein